MYLVNTANRNGQTNGVHCVGVADGIVGQKVFHWQSKLISLFLFKKKISQIVSSMSHNSSKILWIYFSSENSWTYCWMNLCCWKSWQTILFSNIQILAVHHKEHSQTTAALQAEVQKCVLLRTETTYSSEKDTKWESKCLIAAYPAMEEFPLYRKQRSKVPESSHQLLSLGMETATKPTYFYMQPS